MREDDRNPWAQLAEMRRRIVDEDRIGIAHYAEIRDQLREASGRVLQQLEEIDHLRRQLDEAIGQRDHYARRALEAERKCSVYEASLVMLAKEMSRPLEEEPHA